MSLLRDIQDLNAIAGKVNFKKMRNAIQVYQSYNSARKGGKMNHPAMPFAMSIEPTTSCNLRCPECISGLRDFTRPTGMMDLDLYKKIIDQVKEHVIYLTLYFQGEPLLNKAFFEMVKIANEAGIYTHTSSNAHFFTEENAIKAVESGLNRVIVSMDGLDQETYKKYRIGGDIEKVKNGIQTLVEVKKAYKSLTPFIDLQFLAMGQNEHQLDEVEEFGKKLGVDRTLIKTAQVNDYEKGSDFIPKNESFSRYKKMEDGTYALKNRMDNHCWKMWHSCVITWDGQVVPCCFDKDANHSMGSLKEKSFETVWQGEEYNAFRSQLFRSRSEIDICKNCTEGTKVWA